MTNNPRLMLGIVVLAASTARPAMAQHGFDPYSPAARTSARTSTGFVPPGAAVPGGTGQTYVATPQTVMPNAAGNPTALERVNTQMAAPGTVIQDPYATLTGQPPVTHSVQQGTPGLAPGSYPSPYFTDGPGCCGPMGRNGRIGYEVYLYTGPTWSLGEGALAKRLDTGWMVGGGGRSLFFNTSHDAAWVVDLGLSYQFVGGDRNDPIPIFVERPPINLGNGQFIPQSDVISPASIRGIHRTSFNFGLGRDWWVWGPGTVGTSNGWNVRTGGLVGGRWGTAHVDLLPQVAAFGDYQRRGGVTHGVFLATHATCEVPLGTTILFAGLRGEWGYDWMNLIPPLQGNLHNLNLLMTAGLRF